MLSVLLALLLTLIAVPGDQIRIRQRAASVEAGASAYWVDDNGAAANWAACLSSTPLSGASACTMTQANNSATQGHTIYVRAGTYNTQIAPTSDGTLNSRITYQGYNGEAPEVTNVGAAACVQLSGRDYIVVKGFIIHDCDQLINITGGSSYNEIAYNTIRVGNGAANVGINIYTLNAVAGTANTHNWIHHNTIYNGGYVNSDEDSKTFCNDVSGMMAIGGDEDLDSLSDYNTVEDNTIYWGAHHAMKFLTHFNVARNNVMHNEDWTPAPAGCQVKQCAPNGMYGNRVMNVLFNHSLASSNDTYNLIEGNRLGHAGLPSDGNGADVLTLGGQRDIARYNDIYAGQGLGVYARQSGNIAKYLQIYNNTIAYNGIGPVCRLPPINSGFITGALRFPNGAEPNIFINNILNSTTGTEIRNTGNTLNIIAPNWRASDGNPQFTDTTYSDPFSTTQPNFNLQAGSGAINNGTHLGVANGSGSGSTSLVMSTTSPYSGALPFQDGTRGSDLVRTNGTMHADWIAIGTVSNTVQISSINYSTNTITLASAMTWSDGASVWLYKKSDGVIVLCGAAPDQGAHEKC